MNNFTENSPIFVQSSTKEIYELSNCFHALSEPLRLKILDLLKQRELCVCELCEALHASQSKLSFHLKTLKEANLVKSRQRGRWVYYRLNPSQFQVLEQNLAEYPVAKMELAYPYADQVDNFR